MRRRNYLKLFYKYLIYATCRFSTFFRNFPQNYPLYDKCTKRMFLFLAANGGEMGRISVDNVYKSVYNSFFWVFGRNFLWITFL